MDICLIKMESNTEIKVIKAIRNITDMGLAEAKSIVDDLSNGIPFTIKDVNDEYVLEVKNELNGAGVTVDIISSLSTMDNNKINEEKHDYRPVISSQEVANISREETLQVLLETKNIAEHLEHYASRTEELKKQIPLEEKKAEALRTDLSDKAIVLGRVVAIVSIIVCVMIMGVLGIIVGLIIGVIIADNFVEKPDIRKHWDENNLKADKYIKDIVEPMKLELEDCLLKYDEVYNSGQRAWAIDIVGEDMFRSVAIDNLYRIIKSRRADTIKEALIRYDDEQYKNRMEEMQKSIKEASEIASTESIRQSEHMARIEKNSEIAAKNSAITAQNSKKAATAARASAAFSAGTYINTQKINRKL